MTRLLLVGIRGRYVLDVVELSGIDPDTGAHLSYLIEGRGRWQHSTGTEAPAMAYHPVDGWRQPTAYPALLNSGSGICVRPILTPSQTVRSGDAPRDESGAELTSLVVTDFEGARFVTLLGFRGVTPDVRVAESDLDELTIDVSTTTWRESWSITGKDRKVCPPMALT
jgi:hypothetical protein